MHRRIRSAESTYDRRGSDIRVTRPCLSFPAITPRYAVSVSALKSQSLLPKAQYNVEEDRGSKLTKYTNVHIQIIRKTTNFLYFTCEIACFISAVSIVPAWIN